MPRQVLKDLYQLGASVTGDDGQLEAVRVYVMLNDGCPLVFDAGSHLHSAQIMSELHELLGQTAPAYVFLTHTELPHTGNIKTILDAWPDAKLVVSSAILPHVELPWWVREDQVLFGYPGTVETYGGREIAFVDGILKDQPGTHWMYDAQTQTLFTADAFGYLMPSDADTKFDDELPDGIPDAWLRDYHASAFRFLPMCKATRVSADMDRTLNRWPVSVLAPTHGNAIRKTVPQAIQRLHQVISEVCQ